MKVNSRCDLSQCCEAELEILHWGPTHSSLLKGWAQFTEPIYSLNGDLLTDGSKTNSLSDRVQRQPMRYCRLENRPRQWGEPMMSSFLEIGVLTEYSPLPSVFFSVICRAGEKPLCHLTDKTKTWPNIVLHIPQLMWGFTMSVDCVCVSDVWKQTRRQTKRKWTDTQLVSRVSTGNLLSVMVTFTHYDPLQYLSFICFHARRKQWWLDPCCLGLETLDTENCAFGLLLLCSCILVALLWHSDH